MIVGMEGLGGLGAWMDSKFQSKAAMKTGSRNQRIMLAVWQRRICVREQSGISLKRIIFSSTNEGGNKTKG